MNAASSVQIGEIQVPGAVRLHGARTFILTKPVVGNNDAVELLFGVLVGKTQKKIIDKLVDQLINDLRPAFFKGTNDVEARYEEALKVANRTILTFLHEHGLSLPGISLRGAIGAISGNQLLISNRGALKGTVTIPRDMKLSAFGLFDDGHEQATSPKFFSSLQSGTLPPGGRLFVSTSELFQVLDELFVNKLFTEPDTNKLTRELKNALRSSSEPVTILTLFMPDPLTDGVSESAAPAKPAAMKKTTATSTLAPTEAATDPGKFVSHILQTIVSGLWAALKLLPVLGKFLWRIIVLFFKTLLRIPKWIAALFRKESRNALGQRIITAPNRWAVNSIDRLNDVPNSRRIIFLAFFLGAILVGHGIIYTVQHQIVIGEAKAYDSRLAEFKQLETDLETSMIYGDDVRGQAVFAQMQTIANTLPNKTPAQQRAKTALDQSLIEAQNKLWRVAVVESPTVFASINEAGRFKNGSLAWFKNKLYLFSPTEPAVTVIDADGSSSAPVALEGFSGGIAQASPATTGFILLDQDGHVHYWNPSKTTTDIYPEATFIPKNPILFYQSRLYTVEADGSVARRAILSSTLGPPVVSIPAVDSLKNASGLASDATLYLLSPNGELKKYLRGKAVEMFRSPQITPAVTAGDDLWTSEMTPWVLFIDQNQNRLLIIEKDTGRLAQQLESPSFPAIEAMTVDSQGAFASLFANGKIFKVPLPPKTIL